IFFDRKRPIRFRNRFIQLSLPLVDITQIEPRIWIVFRSRLQARKFGDGFVVLFTLSIDNTKKIPRSIILWLSSQCEVQFRLGSLIIAFLTINEADTYTSFLRVGFNFLQFTILE